MNANDCTVLQTMGDSLSHDGSEVLPASMNKPATAPFSQCTPIRDYAVIGDCHGAALVGRHGSIDWCCLERFDADPIFCRLLGDDSAGYFEIQPARTYRSRRHYRPETNILETTFESDEGSVTLIDFMPAGRTPDSDAKDYVSVNAPHWLIRVLDCTVGIIDVVLHYHPCGTGFAAQPLVLHKTDTGVATQAGPQLYSEIDFTIAGSKAETRIKMHAGQRLRFVVTAGPIEFNHPCAQADTLLEVTHAFWKEWAGACNYQGPYRDAVMRSALVLKLLTYAPTGAIVAAPTTSLPECLGGERNWDYRYCWLRDSTFTLYALAALGYEREAGRFNDFLTRCLRETAPVVRIMYGIGYETDLAEHRLDHLQGYCNSRPVRKGNGAYMQRQLDVYGEVLDWALLYRTLGGTISATEQNLLRQMADQVANTWQLPGQGIWEMRGEPRHHVYSKIMCWVALDRALRLFGNNAHWYEASEALRRAIHEHGIEPARGHLTQTFDHPGVDAAVLLAPIVGFPLEHATLVRTVDVVYETLYRKGFVRRYLIAETPDGVAGDEGAFLICSFWLVDALLFLDRRDEATTLFEKLLSVANDVGLLSEEIDPEDGKLLGNFPQALTHLAIIRSAFIMELHEKGGNKSLFGAHADRAQQHANASSAPQTLWTAFSKQPFNAIGASQASVLQRFWDNRKASQNNL